MKNTVSTGSSSHRFPQDFFFIKGIGATQIIESSDYLVIFGVYIYLDIYIYIQ